MYEYVVSCCLRPCRTYGSLHCTHDMYVGLERHEKKREEYPARHYVVVLIFLVLQCFYVFLFAFFCFVLFLFCFLMLLKNSSFVVVFFFVSWCFFLVLFPGLPGGRLRVRPRAAGGDHRRVKVPDGHLEVAHGGLEPLRLHHVRRALRPPAAGDRF